MRALLSTLAFAATATAFAQPQSPAATPTAATASTARGAQDAQSRYHAAQAEYEIGHFTVAFSAFAQLADEGHCESARIARQMVQHARAVYYTEFVVAPGRLAQWRVCPTAMAAR